MRVIRKTRGLIALCLTAAWAIAPAAALAQDAGTEPASENRQQDTSPTRDSPTQGQSLQAPDGEPRLRGRDEDNTPDQTVPDRPMERGGSVGEPNRTPGPRPDRPPVDNPGGPDPQEDGPHDKDPWWRFWD